MNFIMSRFPRYCRLLFFFIKLNIALPAAVPAYIFSPVNSILRSEFQYCTLQKQYYAQFVNSKKQYFTLQFTVFNAPIHSIWRSRYSILHSPQCFMNNYEVLTKSHWQSAFEIESKKVIDYTYYTIFSRWNFEYSVVAQQSS